MFPGVVLAPPKISIGYVGCVLTKRDISHDSLPPKFILEERISKTSLVETTNMIFVFLLLRNTDSVRME